MPENEENTTEGAEPALSEQPISQLEILAELGLDENLQPRGVAEKGEVEEKAAPVEEEQPVSDSGDNAVEDEVVEEEPQEEGEPEEEAEPESEEDWEKKPGSFQRRIKTLTRQNKALEASRKELEAKLEAAAPIVLQPTPRNPLAHLNSEKEVRAEMEQYREMKAWCWKNLNGGELTDSNGRTREVSGEDVRARLSFAEDMLITHAPERLAFLRERARADEVAKMAYPALFDSRSEESRIAMAFLQQVPEFSQVPNYQIILGDAIRGMTARLMEQSGKSGGKVAATNGSKTPTGKPAPKLAPRPIKGQAVATQKPTQQSANRGRLEREFLNTGDKRSLEAFILSTL